MLIAMEVAGTILFRLVEGGIGHLLLITSRKSKDFFLGNSLSWNIEGIDDLPAPMENQEADELWANPSLFPAKLDHIAYLLRGGPHLPSAESWLMGAASSEIKSKVQRGRNQA